MNLVHYLSQTNSNNSPITPNVISAGLYHEFVHRSPVLHATSLESIPGGAAGTSVGVKNYVFLCKVPFTLFGRPTSGLMCCLMASLPVCSNYHRFTTPTCEVITLKVSLTSWFSTSRCYREMDTDVPVERILQEIPSFSFSHAVRFWISSLMLELLNGVGWVNIYSSDNISQFYEQNQTGHSHS